MVLILSDCQWRGTMNKSEVELRVQEIQVYSELGTSQPQLVFIYGYLFLHYFSVVNWKQYPYHQMIFGIMQVLFSSWYCYHLHC